MNDLPSPWADPEACGVSDPYYLEIREPTICDRDLLLPDFHRMITDDLLHSCQESSLDNTKFLLLVADLTGTGADGEHATELDSLMETAVISYNLTKESSAVLFLVTKTPFKIRVWQTKSLTSTITPKTRKAVVQNITEIFTRDGHFPSAVNKLVYNFCQAVRAPPHRPSKWDALTYLWMIIVILLIITITGLVIHLIIVRHKRVHRSHHPGDQHELRANPGRPNVCPLSMELQDFGSPTAYQPSGNLLLSSSDVTAVHQTSSTANLLDS